MRFLGGAVVKNLPANAGNMDSIPGLGRSPGVGNGDPIQYSCLENSVDRRSWQTAVRGVQRARHNRTCMHILSYIPIYDTSDMSICSYSCMCLLVEKITNICCYSITKSCPTLCDPMDCSMSGFPVIQHLPEFSQTHVQ